MGTKKLKGTVSVEKVSNRIRLRWCYQTKRYALNLFLFSKPNLQQAKIIAADIKRDLLSNRFDQTLIRYKPFALQETVLAATKSLVEHFEDLLRRRLQQKNAGNFFPQAK